MSEKLNTLSLIRNLNSLSPRFKKHPSAFMVLKFYAENTWMESDKGKNRQQHVMSGCIWPAVVAKHIPVTTRSVENANDWLQEQGFIEITRDSDRAGKKKSGEEIVLAGKPLAISMLPTITMTHPCEMVSHGYEMISHTSEMVSHGVRNGCVHKEISKGIDKGMIKEAPGADAPVPTLAASISLKDTEAFGVGSASASGASDFKVPVPDSDRIDRESYTDEKLSIDPTYYHKGAYWVSDYLGHWEYRPRQPSGRSEHKWRKVERHEVNPDYANNKGQKFRETKHYEKKET